ncbi:hypothetical protein ACFLRQ_01160 [Bacteroidota bacterium]
MTDNKTNRVMTFMSRNMMACDEAGYLISKSYDSRLTLKKRIGLKIHLMTCHLCRKYEKQLKQLNRLVKGYKENIHDECHHHLDEKRKDSMSNCISKELEINP